MIVHLLRAGRNPEVSISEQSSKVPVLPVRPFMLDDQGKALLKGERGNVRLAGLVLACVVPVSG
jgi:hypothetical protein